ncbi:MAG: cryptochrome/photolyase family protein, partial [Planctomycetota bacterium]|nr:cryptochrome/photolyase family protein [Planctomycetota bacterium]
MLRTFDSQRRERLAIVFGDQLDPDALLIRQLEPTDTVLMMEVTQESRHVPSHHQRTLLFLSAMRHFASHLTGRGIRVQYIALDDPKNTGSFESEITRAVKAMTPTELICTHPGEWRVLQLLQAIA